LLQFSSGGHIRLVVFIIGGRRVEKKFWNQPAYHTSYLCNFRWSVRRPQGSVQRGKYCHIRSHDRSRDFLVHDKKQIIFAKSIIHCTTAPITSEIIYDIRYLIRQPFRTLFTPPDLTHHDLIIIVAETTSCG
jgi:hypothetical protein